MQSSGDPNVHISAMLMYSKFTIKLLMSATPGLNVEQICNQFHFDFPHIWIKFGNDTFFVYSVQSSTLNFQSHFRIIYVLPHWRLNFRCHKLGWWHLFALYTTRKTGAPFAISQWAHNPNLVKNICCSYMNNNEQIRSEICTCHDSWAVMTCAVFWPDWIIEVEMRAKLILTRYQLCTHKLFVKWVLSLCSQ